eukprot:TRINITY_DN15636_c0_g1_i1.p1 TRINITY_DN15636_c0_g1~~TRINITY_DN15636_c0_g1_i1.p1  ORF type:complete len:332 (-),score=41.32 TRINITY_DN15636_c0_g1_i1:309-1229(-)
MAMAPPAASGSASSGCPWTDPLAVSYPSPWILLQYPMFSANINVLCRTTVLRQPKEFGLAAQFATIRHAFKTEGVVGVYRYCPLYFLHQAMRDVLRFLIDRSSRPLMAILDREVETDGEEKELTPLAYRFRLFAKYLVDVAVYPLLLLSTRTIVLHGDGKTPLERLMYWRQQEGTASLFSGVGATLLASALDDAADAVLSYGLAGVKVELADKILLKACGASVASVFTAPITHIGTIQRCQSALEGLLEPRPWMMIAKGLPYKTSLWQLIMFAGILGLNIKLVQWKAEAMAEIAAEQAEERDAVDE